MRAKQREKGSEKRERNINCHLGSLWIRISRDDSRLNRKQGFSGEGKIYELSKKTVNENNCVM